MLCWRERSQKPWMLVSDDLHKWLFSTITGFVYYYEITCQSFTELGHRWPRDTKGSWRSFVVLNLYILELRQTSQWILWHVAHSVTKAYGLSHQNFTPLTFINEPVTIIFFCLFSWWRRGHWRFGFTCECFWYNCSEGFSKDGHKIFNPLGMMKLAPICSDLYIITGIGKNGNSPGIQTNGFPEDIICSSDLTNGQSFIMLNRACPKLSLCNSAILYKCHWWMCRFLFQTSSDEHQIYMTEWYLLECLVARMPFQTQDPVLPHYRLSIRGLTILEPVRLMSSTWCQSRDTTKRPEYFTEPPGATEVPDSIWSQAFCTLFDGLGAKERSGLFGPILTLAPCDDKTDWTRAAVVTKLGCAMNVSTKIWSSSFAGRSSSCLRGAHPFLNQSNLSCAWACLSTNAQLLGS